MSSQLQPLRGAAVTLAGLALAIIPLAMWLANRSAPLCLGVSALACLFIAWCDGWALADKLRAVRVFRSPITKALMLVIVLAFISLFWSHNPRSSLFALGEFLLPLASGVVVAVILPARAPRWLVPVLIISLCLAAALTLAELWFGTGLRQVLGLRPMTFIFNRSLISALVIVIPLLAWLATKRRWGAAFGIALLVGAAIFMSESGAAKLGLIAALVAVAASSLAPRLSLIAASISLVALMLFAPVQGEILERLIPPSAHSQLQDSHSRDRVDIWLSFGEAIRAKPLLGSGFGTSPTLQEHPVAQTVSAPRRALLAVGHPHSAQVQIWAELGVIGAALMLWAGLSLILAIGKRSMGMRSCQAMIAPLATLACAVAIAAVGHGAWQGWWVATLAASVIWFKIFDTKPFQKEPRP